MGVLYIQNYVMCKKCVHYSSGRSKTIPDVFWTDTVLVEPMMFHVLDWSPPPDSNLYHFSDVTLWAVHYSVHTIHHLAKNRGGGTATLTKRQALHQQRNYREGWPLADLKGLSHEIDFKNFDENGQILALTRAAAGFRIFRRLLWFLIEIKHQFPGKC